MTTLKIAAAIAVITIVTTSTAEARRHRHPVQQQTGWGQQYYQQPQYQTYRTHKSRKAKRYVNRSRRTRTVDANGNSARGVVTSHRTGATATVSAAFAPKAQAYIDDIENNYGAKVLFMGGYRRGPCHSGSLHPCGRALDVCQLSRGRVDARCHLPGRVALAAVALKHGLFEGGMWCNNDYGHVQLGVSSGACNRQVLAAVKKFKLIDLTVKTEDEDPEALAYYMGDKPLDQVEKKVAVDTVFSAHRSRRHAHRYRHYRHRTARL